jgi:hypothetical protein
MASLDVNTERWAATPGVSNRPVLEMPDFRSKICEVDFLPPGSVPGA